MGHLEGKVAIITGAAHGLGLSHAELFASEGATVVRNDLHGDVEHHGDCADWDAAKELVDLAIDRHGRLDILVNNAGNIRDRMIFNMSEEEWNYVVRLNLTGHFMPARHACAYWRERAKAGEDVAGRIINTTSASGLFGAAGQTNYAAAKAGVAGFTLALAQEMLKYGVTVNAIAPAAATRDDVPIPPAIAQRMVAEHVSPLVAYLASDRAAGVTGQVFNVFGGRIDRIDGWQIVPGLAAREDPWTLDELADAFDQVAGPTPGFAVDVLMTAYEELAVKA